MKKVGISLILCLFTTVAFGYGVGQITHPLKKGGQLVSAEFTGIMTDGSGVGMQGRYTKRFSDKFRADAGVGLGAGDRSFRIFTGADYELYPDYAKQPRVTLKAGLEIGSEFGNTVTTMSMTPIASKGLSLWGVEGYPFIAVPIGIGLNSSNNTYETLFSVAAGWTGKIPVKSLEKFTASVEMNLGLKDTYTGLFLGMAYPLK